MPYFLFCQVGGFIPLEECSQVSTLPSAWASRGPSLLPESQRLALPPEGEEDPSQCQLQG